VFVIGEIRNPALAVTTSQFSVTSLYNDVPVDKNDHFGTLSFNPPPVKQFDTA